MFRVEVVHFTIRVATHMGKILPLMATAIVYAVGLYMLLSKCEI